MTSFTVAQQKMLNEFIKTRRVARPPIKSNLKVFPPKSDLILKLQFNLVSFNQTRVMAKFYCAQIKIKQKLTRFSLGSIQSNAQNGKVLLYDSFIVLDSLISNARFVDNCIEITKFEIGHMCLYRVHVFD